MRLLRTTPSARPMPRRCAGAPGRARSALDRRRPADRGARPARRSGYRSPAISTRACLLTDAGAARALARAVLRRGAGGPRRGGRGRRPASSRCDQMAERSPAVGGEIRRHPDRRRKGDGGAAAIGIGVNCVSHPADTDLSGDRSRGRAARTVSPTCCSPRLPATMLGRIAQWNGGAGFADPRRLARARRRPREEVRVRSPIASSSAFSRPSIGGRPGAAPSPTERPDDRRPATCSWLGRPPRRREARDDGGRTTSSCLRRSAASARSA